MQVDAEVIAKFASPVVTLFLAGLGWLRKPRSKLVAFFGHVSTFTYAGPPPFPVYAHNIVVRNSGNKSATNVRVTHQVTTENFRVDPPLSYTRTDHPQGGFELKFESLPPKSYIVISYLYFPPLTAGHIGGNVRSDDEEARFVNPWVQPPVWARSLAGFLAAVGAMYLLYWPLRWVAVQSIAAFG